MVSERRAVPFYIPKPSYAQSSVPQDSPKNPEIKDKNQIESMRYSCILAKRILEQIRFLIKVIIRAWTRAGHRRNVETERTERGKFVCVFTELGKLNSIGVF